MHPVIMLAELLDMISVIAIHTEMTSQIATLVVFYPVATILEDWLVIKKRESFPKAILWHQ